MNNISPAWRRALSEGPLRSATIWALLLMLAMIVQAAVGVMVRIAARGGDMLDIPIVTIALVLGLLGYGFWMIIQACQDARAAVGTEHEEILARYSYLMVRMYIIAGACTLLCLEVAEWSR